MKKLPTTLLLLTALALAGPTIAQTASEHASHHPAADQAAAADLADGEVRKIDKETGKLTIKHGEIKNLDMPGMTMVFQVKDVAMLNNIKVGDSVRFSAEKAGGAIVVTIIQLASSPDTGQVGLATVQPTGVMAPVSAKSKAATNTEMTDGEVRKVDLANSKITIKHEEIKNLDMPGMTMVFQVKDAELLAKAKAGDKIRFQAEKSGGAIVVTDIQPAK